jgi:tRNA(Ile)-lysidine synthase
VSGALVPEGSTIVAAVSGGSDSIALLHLLAHWARRRGWTILVAHLDHALRRGSNADRRFVERVARSLALRAVTARQDVRAARRRDESLEEAARRVRRAFLLAILRGTSGDLIATGHTLDDQAETVLMRLVRGAGPTALAGMAARGPGPFVRPLLGFERSELRDYLGRRGHAFREDPTNRDLRFDRNRVRALVLPFLAQHLNVHAARHLVQAADVIREDGQYLDGLAAERAAAIGRTRRSALEIDAAALAGEPAALARRIARSLLVRAGVDARSVTRRHVVALLDLASGGTGRGIDLPGALRARRDRERIVVASPVERSSRR